MIIFETEVLSAMKTHTCTHAHQHTNVHTNKQTNKQTHTHKHTKTHKHTNTHNNTHIHCFKKNNLVKSSGVTCNVSNRRALAAQVHMIPFRSHDQHHLWNQYELLRTPRFFGKRQPKAVELGCNEPTKKNAYDNARSNTLHCYDFV